MALGIADNPGRAAIRVFTLVTLAFDGYFALSDSHSRRLRLWGLAITTLACVSAWLVLWVIRARRRRASASWPAASGAVQSTNLRTNAWAMYPFQGRHMLKIVYDFHAAGERYAGSEDRIFRKEKDAEAEAGRLRNSAVVVKYNPRNPEMSLLTEA